MHQAFSGSKQQQNESFVGIDTQHNTLLKVTSNQTNLIFMLKKRHFHFVHPHTKLFNTKLIIMTMISQI